MSREMKPGDPGDENRRFDKPKGGRPILAGVQVRDNDIEPTQGLRSVATLFRVMSILLLVLAAAQVALGVTSSVDISYGVLIAEAVRLLIFAGLLWGAGDLADLYVKSHYDQRALRVLVARLEYRFRESQPGQSPLGEHGDAQKG